MWILQLNNIRSYWLCPVRQQYTLGRVNCNIVISDDVTVSRKHACFQVRVSNKDDHSELLIQDFSSKQSTFVNGVHVDKNKTIQLKDGDVIKFGHGTSGAIIRRVDYKFCISNISPDAFQLYRDNSKFCDYTISDQWTGCCTHLLLSQRHPTWKAVMALASAKYIVSERFMRDITVAAEAIGQKNDSALLGTFSAPDERDYLPPLAQDGGNLPNVSWYPDSRRRTLLHDFVFIVKNSENDGLVSKLICQCGGSVLVIESFEELRETLQNLSDDNDKGQMKVVLLNTDGCNQESIDYTSLYQLHSVSENAISLSVLYAQLDRELVDYKPFILPTITEAAKISLIEEAVLNADTTPASSQPSNISPQVGKVVAVQDHNSLQDNAEPEQVAEKKVDDDKDQDELMPTKPPAKSLMVVQERNLCLAQPVRKAFKKQKVSSVPEAQFIGKSKLAPSSFRIGQVGKGFDKLAPSLIRNGQENNGKENNQHFNLPSLKTVTTVSNHPDAPFNLCNTEMTQRATQGKSTLAAKRGLSSLMK
ncbi:hypothetical protein MIR68_001207 [Amoeboaphelidium protococcarum]|nr:hypothetical protein MIR68_001207 [Amoeboaphelidium protococcarum]